jgi:hypothetical protein
MSIQTTGLLGVDLTDTPLTAQFALGTTVKTTDGGEYVYVQASGAITQYDWVGIDEDYQCASLTKTIADDGWSVGVAQVAFADNDYGWVAIRGHNLTGRIAASCAADVSLYTSATAGVLDDSSTSQTKIEGVVAVTANASNTARAKEALLTFPRSTTF